METITTPVKITKTRAARIFKEAVAAGDKAYKDAVPTPMIVGTPTTPLGNDIDYSKETYFVSEGLCGFAWVTIRPARGAFVNYLKSIQVGSNGYYGGWRVGYQYTNFKGQSYTRNVAAAGAFSGVLQKYGIDAFSEGRLD